MRAKAFWEAVVRNRMVILTDARTDDRPFGIQTRARHGANHRCAQPTSRSCATPWIHTHTGMCTPAFVSSSVVASVPLLNLHPSSCLDGPSLLFHLSRTSSNCLSPSTLLQNIYSIMIFLNVCTCFFGCEC